MLEHDVRIPSTGEETAGGGTVAVEVAATLCLPEGASGARPVPAVGLMAGSGADTRDGDLSQLRAMGSNTPGTMRMVAHHLAHHGVASLRWDRRGYGSTGGDRGRAGYHTDVEDAVACVRWLGEHVAVDSARVAVAGHSAGALVACRVCRDVPDLAGALLLGALASPIEDMIRWNAARVQSHWDRFTTEQRAWLEEHLAGQLLRGERVEETLEAARRGEDRVRLAGPGVELDLPLVRLRQDLATDYEAEMDHVRVPALVLHGGDDLNVGVADAQTTYRRLRRNGNDAVELVILSGLDHYFVPTPADPQERIWERISLEALRTRSMSPKALEAISSWVVRALV